MLTIQNLTVQVNDHTILKNLSLQLAPGSTHAVMGPNGSGKSTLAYTIMGHPNCQVTAGTLHFQGHDITDLTIDQRARRGLFLAFQYPQAVPGLSVFNFLHAAYNAFASEQLVATEQAPVTDAAAQSANQPVKNISVTAFKALLDDAVTTLGFNPELLTRALNDGFSGGEKKRLEMLQLYLLRPKLAIIDEIDSGLDVDALKTVAYVLQACRQRDPEFTLLLVTHYRRILDYLVPEFVHVVAGGQLVATGSAGLAQQIDQAGYGQYGA